MKKIFIISAAVIFSLSFCSCNKNVSSEPEADTSASVIETVTDGCYESIAEITTEEETSDFPTGEVYGQDTGTDKTYTGYEPLDKVILTLPSDVNYSEYSQELIEHSFGSASDEQPHEISIRNQKYMAEHNFDAICYDEDAEDKIIYLTFDVGYENGYTMKILDVLKEKNVPAAFFCTQSELEKNPEVIAKMIKDGHIIGNHSVTHPNFATLSKDEIIEELQGFDDYIRENFGYSSSFFRFPEGKYSDFSEKIITDLGYTSVFWSVAYVDWDINNQPDSGDALDTIISRIHPGAVYLLHAVSSTNYEILGDFIDEARSMGYEFVSLSDYKEAH